MLWVFYGLSTPRTPVPRLQGTAQHAVQQIPDHSTQPNRQYLPKRHGEHKPSYPGNDRTTHTPRQQAQRGHPARIACSQWTTGEDMTRRLRGQYADFTAPRVSVGGGVRPGKRYPPVCFTAPSV